MAAQDIERGADAGAIADYRMSWITINALLRSGRSWSGHERHCVYLNLGEGSMANISSISGLDYPEDGRGLALTDWDHDGDWDLWITNRTAPTVRVLRNEVGQDAHFIALRLQGTTANRDAIGARVTLLGTPAPAIQTVRAGDAFVSHSSKWIQFGLGAEAPSSLGVSIRWPDGTQETLTDLPIDQRYTVIQGSGGAVPLPGPPPLARAASTKTSVLKPDGIDSAPSPGAGVGVGGLRTVAYSRLPFPRMRLPGFPNQAVEVGGMSGVPFLVNLWGSWCAPCLRELGDLARRASDLENRGLRVYALSTDRLDPEIGDEEATREVVKKLGLPFTMAWADDTAIAGLEAVQRVLLDEQSPLPSSFLVDDRGRMAVLYRGPVTAEQVLADIELLPHSGTALNEIATPFEGIRHSWPSRIDPLQVALKLYESGDVAHVRRYLGQLIETEETKAPGHEDVSGDALHYFLGTLLEEAGQRDRSIAAYQSALRHNPQHAQAHRNLARQLLRAGKIDPALDHFQQASAHSTHDDSLRFEWISALYQTRRLSDAIEALHGWIRDRPGNPRAMRLLSWILSTSADSAYRNGEEALRLARASFDGNPATDPAGAQITAAALAELGRFDEAIGFLDGVIATQEEVRGANGPAQSAAAAQLATLKRHREAYARKQPWRER